MSQFNTIAGWSLAGGIVALGTSIVVGEVFHAERPETMGYVVEGVVESGGEEEAELTMAAAFPQVTVEQGEAVFRRCASCHTVNEGGANGIGPNLYGVVGAQHAHRGDFNYSSALSEMSGPWTFDNLSEWLVRPAAYAQGTTMSFAGLSDPLDRAAVILYLNAQGSNLPLPEPPAAEEPEAEEGEAAEGDEAADPEAETETDDIDSETAVEAEPAA